VNATTDVWSAEVAFDGSLKEFRAEESLPAARTQHGVIVSGGALVVLGGGDAQMFVSTPTSGNHAANWRAQGKLEHPAASAAIASNGEDVLFLGGQIASGILDESSMLTIDKGIMRQARSAEPLPSARTRFAAVRLGSMVFTVGGETGAGPIADVLFGQVRSDDGTLGRWQSVTPLSRPRVDHAVVAAGDSLFVLGGYTGADIVDEVVSGKISDQGSLHGWNTTTKLPSPRYAHCATTSGAHIYVVGGLNADSPMDEVLETTANQNGTLNEWRIVGHLPAGRAHVGCAVR